MHPDNIADVAGIWQVLTVHQALCQVLDAHDLF